MGQLTSHVTTLSNKLSELVKATVCDQIKCKQWSMVSASSCFFLSGDINGDIFIHKSKEKIMIKSCKNNCLLISPLHFLFAPVLVAFLFFPPTVLFHAWFCLFVSLGSIQLPKTLLKIHEPEPVYECVSGRVLSCAPNQVSSPHAPLCVHKVSLREGLCWIQTLLSKTSATVCWLTGLFLTSTYLKELCVRDVSQDFTVLLSIRVPG